MTTAADYPNQSWPNPGWQNTAWGQNAGPNGPGSNGSGSNAVGPGGYGPGGFGPNGPWTHHQWQHWGMSRGFGVAATVLGFIVWWPFGLALLFFMLATGRMGGCGRRWRRQFGPQGGWQAPNWGGWCGKQSAQQQRPSGNAAFDDYRAETLRRLEEEQNDFTAFLERLRFAKDKAEFDQFMADRRRTPPPPQGGDGQPPQG